ncbi:TPA: MurR/RpiR family transcriptional regulator [Streptococcus suis]
MDPVDADLTWSSLQPLFTFSPSALTRFAKKCGFSGYREFVFTYQKDHQYLLKHFDHIQRSLTKKVLMDYDQILAATNNLVDEEKLEEIAKLIDNSKSVYFYGIGSSCKP